MRYSHLLCGQAERFRSGYIRKLKSWELILLQASLPATFLESSHTWGHTPVRETTWGHDFHLVPGQPAECLMLLGCARSLPFAPFHYSPPSPCFLPGKLNFNRWSHKPLWIPAGFGQWASLTGGCGHSIENLTLSLRNRHQLIVFLSLSLIQK
jgi:hypothetical protein